MRARTLRDLALAAALALTLAGVARGDWQRGPARSDVQLQGDGRSWRVEATLNGRVHGVFLLDTGATFCVLGTETARRLQVTPIREVRLHTANGIVTAPLVRIGTLQVGSNRAQGVEAVVHDSVPAPLDGIIGLSFLNRFTYAVEPQRGVLRLR